MSSTFIATLWLNTTNMVWALYQDRRQLQEIGMETGAIELPYAAENVHGDSQSSQFGVEPDI